MKKVQAVFENGIFRPLCDVNLPEQTAVEFEPRVIDRNQKDAAHQDRIYALLSDSFDTDEPDLAARHDEHQP